VGQVGEQSTNIARNSVLAAGFPESVPGVTVDRQCGSSQQAIAFAAASVISGNADVVIAGGVESMSHVPMSSNMAGGTGPFSPEMIKRYPDLVHQGISAEMIAEQWKLPRQHLDELAAISQQRAAAASDAGLFKAEIAAIDGVDTDQGIRPGTTVESLGALKPVFNPDGVVTAGNASQISDGSAAVLIMTSERAKELGLTPIARIHTNVMAGVDPVIMLTGPIPATEKVLKKSGLSLGDIGTFEVNEAFASVLGAWLKDTGADHALTNPNGGAIALGHPLGASGARIMTTMLHHMQRENIRFGLQTMCEGGGMANATIIELL
jgi:acetyl-CoA acyltransferase